MYLIDITKTTLIHVGNMQVGKRLALFSIQRTDLTSFSEDERGVKWLCNEPKPYPYSNP
jgi:hypothetical protein